MPIVPSWITRVLGLVTGTTDRSKPLEPPPIDHAIDEPAPIDTGDRAVGVGTETRIEANAQADLEEVEAADLSPGMPAAADDASMDRGGATGVESVEPLGPVSVEPGT